MPNHADRNKLKYYLLCLSGYLIYGVQVFYWKAVQSVPSIELLALRAITTAAMCAVFLLFLKKTKAAVDYIKTPGAFILMLMAALSLGTQWGVYIYAVSSGLVLQCSLAYFITPILTALSGILFFREKLDRYTLASLLIAAGGVLYMTVANGNFPFIAFMLALSFPIYLSIRKIANADPFVGSFWESTIMCPAALGFLIWLKMQNRLLFLNRDGTTIMLILFAGVITLAPLVMIIGSQKHITLISVGLLNYVSPILQLIFGLYIFHEPMTPSLRVALVSIVTALSVFTYGQVRKLRKMEV